MLTNVFTKTLRDLRRALLGWGIALAVLVAVIAALWPSIRGMPDIEQFLEGYPDAMRELFDIEAITTGAGYLNAELFSMLLPALFVVFAIGRGAKLVAGEEVDGTLEVILVTPVSRTQLVLEKAAALAVAITALGAVLFVAVLVASAVADMGIAVRDAATGALAMVLIGLLHGWLALSVGAATGRRALAVGAAASVAVAGYVLHVAGALAEAVAPFQPWSPFTRAVASGPVGPEFPLGFAWLALAAVATIVVAVPAFERRDIAAR